MKIFDSRSIILIIFLLGTSAVPAAAKQDLAAKERSGLCTPSQRKICFSAAVAETETAVEKTRRMVAEVVSASYPELADAEIRVKVFSSRADFFRARFSVFRFVTLQKARYLIFVNPRIFTERDAPSVAAVRAVIAHELAHLAYYRRHNRFELFGLASLLSVSFNVRFERAADLEAMRRGYGPGLMEFRQWLYRHIPARNISEKRRNYVTPEEIGRILEVTADNPELFELWRKKVPRSLAEINSEATDP